MTDLQNRLTKFIAYSTTLIFSTITYATDFGFIIREEFFLSSTDSNRRDRVGSSVAVNNGIVAAGSYKHNNDAGAVFLFDRESGDQLFKLVPEDGQPGDWFGLNLAMDNGLVVIGARYNPGDGFRHGAAYVFDAISGQQIHKLLPDDGEDFTDFGYDVAIEGNTIVVGCPQDNDNGTWSGSAYIFDATTGTQLHKLLPDDALEYSFFGVSVVIDNSTIAVGADADDSNGNESGSVYLFDASSGKQTGKLFPNDGSANDRFGFKLALKNGILAAGSTRDDDNGFNSGSAYLFDTRTGEQIAKLVPEDGTDRDFFGWSIDLDDDYVAVGAILNESNGFDSGAAYLFDSQTGSHLRTLNPCDASGGDHLGYSIAIDDSVVFVGAPGNDLHATDVGSVYLFDLNNCIADFNNDSILDSTDIFSYLHLFGSASPQADINCDGTLDYFDASGFLQMLTRGCLD